jgi:acetyltransferase-like isoleucine patch superfamily enzyme
LIGSGIDDNCQIGSFCRFENTNHTADSEEYIEINLGNNVWLGAGCIILPGTVIDDNTIIGAGAVVKGQISGGGLWIGIPARKIRN